MGINPPPRTFPMSEVLLYRRVLGGGGGLLMNEVPLYPCTP
jgi:hypothetical protein